MKNNSKRISRRPDGRRANQLRPVSIETGVLKFPMGSVLIKAGDTHVLCAASVEDGVPEFLAGKGQGWVTAEYEMMPASTPRRKRRASSVGRLDGRSQEIRRLIGRSLRTAVDMKRLGERTIWLDCDVIQADGGTRTLAVTGAWVALALAIQKLCDQKTVRLNPLRAQVAAVSVGIVEGRCLLDLCYAEDVAAEVDMNVVRTREGTYIEIQGTAENAPFDDDQLNDLLRLAKRGCGQLLRAQSAALKGASRRRGA